MSFLEIGGEKKYLFGRDGAKKLAEKLGINFLGDLPLRQEISDSTEIRLPFMAQNPNSEIAVLFRRVSELVSNYASTGSA